MMTLDDYQNMALRTIGNADLAVCALGLSDIVKKHVGHDHPLDKVALACFSNAVGVSLEEACEANIVKLRKRYPKGFDSLKSRNRTE